MWRSGVPLTMQLHVIHDHGGGIARWCRDFCLADAPGVNLVLAPYSASDAMGEGLVLYTGDADMTPLAYWPFTTPIHAVAETHPEYRRAIEAIVRDYHIGVVLVSSLIGHALDVLDTGLSTLVVNHDYFPLCPTINLHFGAVCRQCDDSRLADCAAHNPNFNPFPALTVAERLRIRARFLELVTRKGTAMVVPDESVHAHLLQVFPALRTATFATIAHGTERLAPVDCTVDRSAGRLRVMVLGILPAHKGLQLLSEALPRLVDFVDVHLVGAKEYGELFLGTPGVRVVEGYAAEELPGIVATIQPDLGLLLSIVPETYSYTLSELFELGIPPVATRLGAFASRIVAGETGYLFEPDAESLLACLRGIDADRQTLRKIRSGLPGLPARTAVEMVEDYLRLMPVRAGGAKTVSRGVQDPAMTLALERAREWKTRNALRHRLHMKERRLFEQVRGMNGLREALAEREQLVRQLEHEAREKGDLVAERDAQLAAVYASTSWRWSWPLRWLGRTLRRARRRLTCPPSPLAMPEGAAAPVGEDSCQAAFRHYQKKLMHMRGGIQSRIRAMPRRPLISVVTTADGASEPRLRGMLDSVLRQWYEDWELCIIDDGALPLGVRAILETYAADGRRIRWVPTADRVLERAAGEFVVWLSAVGELEEHALFRIAEAVLEDAPDMLYSDAALVAADGESVSAFRFCPVFSPEFLRSYPYIGHLAGFTPALLKAAGGFGEGPRSSRIFELILRASERAEKIAHIPEMLYRERLDEDANPQREQEALGAALESHLQRCGEAGDVTAGASFNFFDVRYPLVPGLKVAIVIPTRNHHELVRACIESIERTTGGVAHDIVLVDHESDDPAALAYLDSLRARVTLLRYRGPFNFAAINNWAVAQLDGSHTHYLFCNNDVEAIAPGWLERMLELGQKADVGVVGAKLYYPDRKTIQHAGVVVVCCGVAENLGRFRETTDAPPDLGYLGSLVCNREVSAVTGACMLVRRNVFVEIGGFDESIAVGYGDVDLCLRAGRRGYRTLFCAHAALLHHESYTRGRMPEDPHPEDSARFLAKWQAAFAAGDPYFNPNLSSHSPNWQVAEPLEFRLDIQRRLFVRGQPLAHLA